MLIDEVLQRIQGEFVEMPGLRLTAPQAQRLWGLERDLCDALLVPSWMPSSCLKRETERLSARTAPCQRGLRTVGAVIRWLSPRFTLPVPVG